MSYSGCSALHGMNPNFLKNMTGYLPLIQKDSITDMHGVAVYVKEGLSFAWDLSLDNSADSYLCF